MFVFITFFDVFWSVCFYMCVCLAEKSCVWYYDTSRLDVKNDTQTERRKFISCSTTRIFDVLLRMMCKTVSKTDQKTCHRPVFDQCYVFEYKRKYRYSV